MLAPLYICAVLQPDLWMAVTSQGITWDLKSIICPLSLKYLVTEKIHHPMRQNHQFKDYDSFPRSSVCVCCDFHEYATEKMKEKRQRSWIRNQISDKALFSFTLWILRKLTIYLIKLSFIVKHSIDVIQHKRKSLKTPPVILKMISRCVYVKQLKPWWQAAMFESETFEVKLKLIFFFDNKSVYIT